MRYRRLGRLEHRSSVLMYGAAGLADVDQGTATESLQRALDAGVNHIDVAASYGDAELRVGHEMPAIRDRIFLATKTGEREEEAAWAEINRSLERLQTDHVDLLQLHAVGSIEELDRATGRHGALQAAIRARDEGLTRGIGITGHGHDAPATHLQALRRFPFDTVLTPWNPILARRTGFADDFRALVEEIRRQDVGLMVIKAVARRNWPQGQQRYSTWYEPFDDQRHITATIAWVLSHEFITALATPGEVRLLPMVWRAEREAEHLDAVSAEAMLADTLESPDYESPFVAMPF